MSGDIRVSGECGTKKENRPPQISGEQPLEAHATDGGNPFRRIQRCMYSLSGRVLPCWIKPLGLWVRLPPPDILQSIQWNDGTRNNDTMRLAYMR